MAPTGKISLSNYQWHFREKTSKSWTPCSMFPTQVHHELKLLGQLPDEGIEFNERKIQWVGEKDWVFYTSFPTPEDIDERELVELVFDGLDTVAEVKLNGEVVLRCDNMFVPERVEVKELLRREGDGEGGREGENRLEILFESAARIAREREEKYEKETGKKFIALRESSRQYIRKAQYQWGWDWGPAMITSGPYKDIRLELSGPKYLSIHVQTSLSDDHNTANLTITFEIANPVEGACLTFNLHHPDTSIAPLVSPALNIQCNPQQTTYSKKLSIYLPILWWPVGHGLQKLYTIIAQLHHNEAIVDTRRQRFGIRRVELIQYPLKSDTEDGTTFYFRVNGRPIFCKGTNWVPPSSLYPRIAPELYHKWLDLALENNNNMLRIWGGGMYEGDAFYDYCDDKGIMIWQDAMFACGIYPLTDSFHSSVKREIAAQATRLRNHPSIVLLCGDNELFFMLDRQGTPYDPTETCDFTAWPERKLIFETIPNVLETHWPGVPYHPSSPFGGSPANSPITGDVHQWSVWHNEMLHYQLYPKLGGRFVSEYGLHSFPDIRTIRHFAPDKASRYPNSKVMDAHNKSSGSEVKLPRYLFSNFRLDWNNLPITVYVSQLMQSEALTYANRSWRRGWKGTGKEECGGVLIWQLNDIYPVTSWSLVDSFFRKKAAFYTTKRDFAEVMVGVERDPVWLFVPEDERSVHRTNVPTFEVFVSNLGLEVRDLELRVRMYDWHTHREIPLPKDMARQRFEGVKGNQSTELCTVECPEDKSSGITEESLIVLSAVLHDASSGEELSRHFSWPEPYRYLLASKKTTVSVSVGSTGGEPNKVRREGIPFSEEGSEDEAGWEMVTLTCGPTPAKGVLAYMDPEDGEEAEWAENMVDMMPNEEVKLRVKGLEGRKVRVKWLYCWEQNNEK